MPVSPCICCTCQEDGGPSCSQYFRLQITGTISAECCGGSETVLNIDKILSKFGPDVSEWQDGPSLTLLERTCYPGATNPDCLPFVTAHKYTWEIEVFGICPDVAIVLILTSNSPCDPGSTGWVFCNQETVEGCTGTLTVTLTPQDAP